MDIFISWSGLRSKFLAKSLKCWIPYIVHQAKPFMSNEDIKIGTQWMRVISNKLDSCNFGIICLTPENINEPWINFEAGALAKKFDIAHLCPCLFDIEPSSLTGPLSQFQSVRYKKLEIKNLIETINQCMGVYELDKERLSVLFDMFWPKLREKIITVPKYENMPIVTRSDRDILEELLSRVRVMSNDQNFYKDIFSDDALEPKRCTNPKGCDGIMLYQELDMEHYCPKCKYVE